MHRTRQFKQKLLGLIFLLPGLFFLGAFLVYPVINGIVLSFTDWNGFSENAKFIGLKNYISLFTSTPDYWNGMKVVLFFAFASTAIQTVLGFFLAFLVSHMTKKWQNFYKVALYLPVILPAAVVAVMWRFMLGADAGMINELLRALGLEAFTHSWLGEKDTAMWAVIMVNTWQYVGFTMVLYYISMQNISKDVLESAEIDGANKWHKLRYFFLPLTMGTTETNIIYSITGGMKSFALFYMLTGGGPGTATRVVALVIYNKAFVDYRFSSALAMSTILFAIILTLTLVARTTAGYFNYENEG